MSAQPFGQRLMAAVQAKNSVLCVGLDPRVAQLPKHLREQAIARHGETPAAYAQACLEFCKQIATATHEFAACVKPNSAFFECFGWQGVQAWEQLITHCRSLGLLIIADIKRGDIGSTAEAYAQAHTFGRSENAQTQPLPTADAVTLNPFLGMDTLTPWLKACESTGTGMFVLVKTSNPGSGDFQDLALNGVVPENLYQRIAQAVVTVGQSNMLQPTPDSYSSVGAVVGATYPEQLKELRARMPRVPFLVPGYGAQGGGSAAVAGGFDRNGLGAVVNSSRGICFAWKQHNLTEKDFAQAARLAAQAARDDLNTARG